MNGDTIAILFAMKPDGAGLTGYAHLQQSILDILMTRRGERVDVLEVWDSETLAFKYEVVLPPKRAQALNYRGLVRPTGDGRFVLVQNATPATNSTVPMPATPFNVWKALNS